MVLSALNQEISNRKKSELAVMASFLKTSGKFLKLICLLTLLRGMSLTSRAVQFRILMDAYEEQTVLKS